MNMTIRAIKETNGYFTVWKGDVTIIDNRTGQPLQFRELDIAWVKAGVNFWGSRVVSELEVPAHKYQMV
jgi:hypothetical protein